MKRSHASWILFVALSVLVPALLALRSVPESPVSASEPRIAALDGVAPIDGLDATAIPSACQAQLSKAADPAAVLLGDSSMVSMGISVTCPARSLPVDLIFVVDESNSMTAAKGGGQIEDPTETPDPNNTPDPSGNPGGGGSGVKPGDEPEWCSRNEGVSEPTATRTRRPRPGRPTGVPVDPEPTDDPEQPGNDDLVRVEKQFVQDFLKQDVIMRDMESDRLHVGLISFNETVRVKQGLTQEASKITSAVGRLKGVGITKINTGIAEANRMIVGTGSRKTSPDDQREKVVVILSDFNFCQRDLRGGGKIDQGTDVITVGLGRNQNRKNQVDLATDRKYSFDQNDMKELVTLYETDFAGARPVALRELKAKDQLMDAMHLVPDSVNPPTVTITGQLLEWVLDPAKVVQALSYRVEPQELGLQYVSQSAGIEWTDSEGLLGKASFPEVSIDVSAYTATPTDTATATATSTSTATPTATSTATSTPTRTPAPAYLPMIFKLWPEPPKPEATICVPERQTLDLALVIDTSNSMDESTSAGGQAKIDAAIAAAKEIVNQLKPTDQATVVGFNTTATTASPLTADKAALVAALDSLKNLRGSGTAIDAGLREGRTELVSSRHVAGNTQALILVTDGEQSVGGPDDVRAAANEVKGAGIKLVTVGLGMETDDALLQEIASAPNMFQKAPDAADLAQIYREIARLIPCP